jgi:hypothetical protein
MVGIMDTLNPLGFGCSLRIHADRHVNDIMCSRRDIFDDLDKFREIASQERMAVAGTRVASGIKIELKTKLFLLRERCCLHGSCKI